MTSYRETIKYNTHFCALKIMQDNLGNTLHDLTEELGISLGVANYCLQALVEMGGAQDSALQQMAETSWVKNTS
jgi:hypothetical protein